MDLAIATKAKDSAQLAGARGDLERFQTLAPQNLTSTQVLQEQQALVVQLAAQVKGEQANIENARTQLGYTTITAPIQGITGIRRVDPGNIVHATDTTATTAGRLRYAFGECSVARRESGDDGISGRAAPRVPPSDKTTSWSADSAAALQMKR